MNHDLELLKFFQHLWYLFNLGPSTTTLFREMIHKRDSVVKPFSVVVSSKEDKIPWSYYDESRPTVGQFRLDSVIKYNLGVLIYCHPVFCSCCSIDKNAMDLNCLSLSSLTRGHCERIPPRNWPILLANSGKHQPCKIDSLRYLLVYLRF